jgi:Na+/proline symporter
MNINEGFFLSLADWFIIVSYFIFSLLVGLWYTRRAGRGMNEFFLGGRDLSWWLAGVSMVATTFAADTPLAVTELVVKHGISGNWVWWNLLLGGMLTTFFFAKLWRRANILTDLEFIELRYSGKEATFLRGFRAIYLGLFMNTLIMGWVNFALLSILKVFFGLSYQEALVIVGFAMIVTVIYSSLSGLIGVAVTDFLQFIVAMTGCIILAVLVINSEQIGGITGLKDKLNSVSPQSLDFFPHIGDIPPEEAGQKFVMGIASFFAFVTITWWASWYPGAEPGGGGYIAQRMMSTRNEKHAIASVLFFQIAHYALRPWPWILVGLASIILYPGLEEKQIGYVMAMKDFLPSGLRGLLLVAFFAAYMSTMATQMNWGTSYIINDLYKRFIKTSSTEEHLVAVARFATVVIMIVAFAITTVIKSIADVWVFIMEAGAGLGLVLILRWYWWRINAWSEIVATIAPFIAFAISKYVFGWTFPYSFFFTVGFTTVAWIAATYLTKPTDLERLEDFYTLIKPQGVWEPVRKALRLPKPPFQLGMLTICWLSAVAMCYSALFLIGKLIFQEWETVMWLTGVLILSFIILYYSAKKVKVFED